jgi:hypothetical protein
VVDTVSPKEPVRYFPFQRIGLRSNPFRTLTDAEWMQVAVLPACIDKLLPDGFLHLQVLGDAGRGKTTTLLALKHRLEKEGKTTAYEYISPGQSDFATQPDGLTVFILDEAQRLHRRAMRRLLASAERKQAVRSRLIFSSHRDLSPSFRRRNIPLNTCRLGCLTPAFLKQILAQRLGYFCLGEKTKVRFTEESVIALIGRFGSDVRAMERHLYEVFQTLPSKRCIANDSNDIVLQPTNLFQAPG